MKTYGGVFDLENKKLKLKETSKLISSSDFWNRDDAGTISKEYNSEIKLIENIETNIKTLKDDFELLNLIEENETEEIIKDLQNINKTYEKLKLFSLLSNPYDKNNCIMDINSGAGGTEANDWALMLYRMYIRYFDANNYKYRIIDYQSGEEAGMKSCTIQIEKEYAYGYLKGESGVHRLVRISPFDSSSRRHTSFAAVNVYPVLDEVEVDIDEKDLRIDVFRSSGKGGQGVNTTDSAVRITHLPTGIVVSCQNERSQLQNKDTAMKILQNKILLLEESKSKEELSSFKNIGKIEFGNQIRNYVLHPYTMVKDLRTKYSETDADSVLDGNIDEFIKYNLIGDYDGK